MSHPYDLLSPDLILNAVESTGWMPDGSLLALNSYENRVYQIGINDQPPIIGKFYRPDRWSDQAIAEEHQFSLELAKQEIPVIAPWGNNENRTLFQFEGYRFALFPRQGGRTPELDNPENLRWIGRLIARIHLLGDSGEFLYRQRIETGRMGHQAIAQVLDSGLMPNELRPEYQKISNRLIQEIEPVIQQSPARWIRLHGDCHPGNILWTDEGPHFVDMDDCMMGPAIQDLWMLLSGDAQEMSLQMQLLLEGYYSFREFDLRELRLIEALRSLRLIHYSAWLANRWDDPAFPKAFGWFGSDSYWREHIQILEGQIDRISNDVIKVY